MSSSAQSAGSSSTTQPPIAFRPSLLDELSSQSDTASPLSILAVSETEPASDSVTTWWLERKARRQGQTVKISQPLQAMEVSYERTAFQIKETRVTLDRNVHDHRGALEQVVVEVKGPMPKWLRKLLPPEDKNFSKSRWAAREV